MNRKLMARNIGAGNRQKIEAGLAQLGVDADGVLAGAGPQVLGPFAFDHNSPQIGTNGYLLTTIDRDSLILAVYVFIDDTWTGANGLVVLLGDPNVDPANLWAGSGDPPGPSNPSTPPVDGGIPIGQALDVSDPGITDGGVYAQCSNTVSAGAARLYLVVA